MSRNLRNEFANKTVCAPALMWANFDIISCVYKLFFDDSFYIGSSLNLRERFIRHFANIRANKHSIALLDAFENCKCIKLEIVEFENNHEILREKERDLILKNIENPLCLNKALSTKCNTGVNASKKLIRRYSKDSQMIVFSSITEAAKSVNYEVNIFRRDMNLGYIIKGYVFCRVDKDGNSVFVPPKSHYKGKWSRKEPFIFDVFFKDPIKISHRNGKPDLFKNLIKSAI